MARSQQMFTQPGQMYAPDTQRRLAMAQALRSQGLQMPQGQMMGSGAMQRFAAPHWSQYVGNLAQNLSGAYMEHQAEQTNQDRMSELVQALRGTDSPEYVMEPGYEQPSQMDRLAALEDNPLAQQYMMSGAMQGGAEPDWQKVDMNTGQGVQTGFVDMNSSTPEATFRPLGEAVAEEQDYNQMIIEGPDGKPMINPLYVQGKEQIAAAGAPSSNVDVNMPDQTGPIPKDHRAVYDEAGRLSHYEVIPGSPTAREMEASEDQAEDREEQKRTYATIADEDIDRAIELAENSSVPTTGFASVLSDVPGTPTHDLAKTLDSLKSYVGFERLQRMREASPTGGALGQVSNMEIGLLQAAYGSLEQSQSKEQFVHNLKRFKSLLRDVVHGPAASEGQSETTNRPEPSTQPEGGTVNWDDL